MSPTMIHKLFHLIFCVSLLSKGFCDIAMSDRPAMYVDGIPNEEKIALASIVEDNPEEIMAIAKDWQSPEYPLLFRQALPIPPAKQPK
jgi:hypothetical protein